MELTVSGSFGSHTLLVALWPHSEMSIKTQKEETPPRG